MLNYQEPLLSKSRVAPKAYSVSQLNKQIREILESQYASIWVEGEISNLKRHSSGHIYLSLKDDKAQISAAFFSRQNQLLKFELKDGMQVLAFGKVSLYEARGQYQFYIDRLEPKGMGALQLAFNQLREKLEREGLFDHERKRMIPKFPKVVGIVTSPTGAAIRDILNVINRRFCGTEILIYPVQVQGEGAAQQIARAIQDMNRLGGIDVLIVGRGGGSLEDLWAFNEEVVARAVFASEIPIISAVGHEIDWTICDWVADLRAPTPSAAAELVVQDRLHFEKQVRDIRYRMQNAMQSYLEDKRQELFGLQESYAFKQPGVLIEQYGQKVDEMLRQLQNYTKSYFLQKSQEFQGFAGKLHALSPLAILERGYSLSFNGSRLLKEARDVKAGDEITTRLWKGTVRSTVKEVED